MDLQHGIETMLKRSNAFHDRYGKAYGQLILKIDDDRYLMSQEHLLIRSIRESDISVYDIHTGDIGAIFRAFRDINAMVFICTEASVAFSQNSDIMRPALDDLAQIVGPDVRVADSPRASSIIAALKDRNGCFVRGAGIFSIGRDIEQAIASARTIEKCAQAEIYSKIIGGPEYLPASMAGDLRLFYDRSYSLYNRSDSPVLIHYDMSEFDLRSKLIETGKKMCWYDLVQGSWGNISVRLNSEEMLITPSGMDYFEIHNEDIVKVNINNMQYDKRQRKPSTESMLHAAIYRTYPDAGAVIHTHSNGCSTFAAARKGFRIDVPELANVIGDLNVSEFSVSGSEQFTYNVMKALYGSHACIIANHGAIFYGKDLDIVLAIANAVESRACNLLGFGTITTNADE